MDGYRDAKLCMSSVTMVKYTYVPHNISKGSEDWFELVLQTVLVAELLHIGGSGVEVVARHGGEQTGKGKRTMHS